MALKYYFQTYTSMLLLMGRLPLSNTFYEEGEILDHLHFLSFSFKIILGLQIAENGVHGCPTLHLDFSNGNILHDHSKMI